MERPRVFFLERSGKACPPPKEQLSPRTRRDLKECCSLWSPHPHFVVIRFTAPAPHAVETSALRGL